MPTKTGETRNLSHNPCGVCASLIIEPHKWDEMGRDRVNKCADWPLPWLSRDVDEASGRTTRRHAALASAFFRKRDASRVATLCSSVVVVSTAAAPTQTPAQLGRLSYVDFTWAFVNFMHNLNVVRRSECVTHPCCLFVRLVPNAHS